jgi:hypothetical protein
MKRITFCTLAALPLLLASAASGRVVSASGPDLDVAGLWSGTVFYGDPTDPTTPKEQFLASVDPHGLYTIDSTAATGSHAVNPGAKTEERGLWQRHGRSIVTHGFFFDEGGGGAGFSLGRGTSRLEFSRDGVLVGFADVDFLPCPAGPLGCPDPVDVGPLELGSGLGPFPVVLRPVR